MFKKVFVLLVVGLLAGAAYPVTLVNPSFELPGTVKQNCWDGGTNAKGTFEDVPGWSSDTIAADSGVESSSSYPATDGEWTGFIKGNDPSVWQLTDYVIGADDVLVLKVDAANNWAATTLRMTIYYDDAGARVSAVSEDVEISDTMATYSVTLVAADAPDSIGKLLGIEFDNVTEEGESWIGIDNVRLGPPPPPLPAPTHSWTFEGGSTADSVGGADGTLVGGAEIIDGAMVTTAQDQWMEMPGDVIDINSYDAITIAAWYTPTAGANTGWSMLAYLGGSDSSDPNTGAPTGVGIDGYFMTTARADDKSRAAFSTGSSEPWADETGADGPEYDDGLLHYMVSTLDADEITLYIDGVLVAATPMDPANDNNIHDLSNDYVLLAKGGYGGDPEWIGAIDEFNIYNRVLSGEEIATLYAIGPLKVGPQPIDPGVDGLLAYYPLDAAYRGSVPDGSGNGNDGTVLGDPAFVEGVAGLALDLDGDGDYVDCGANPLFGMQETNNMTAAAWVTIRSIANQWAAIVAKGEHAWRLGNASLDPRFHFGITIWNAPDTASTDGVASVGFDEWHHVAGVFDGANIILYVDGALDISVPTTEPIGTNDLNVFIGDNPEATGRYWDGLVDEVLIYNKALSLNEVMFLAQ